MIPADLPPASAIHAPAHIDLDRLTLAIEEREGSSWDKPGGRACWTKAAWRETMGSVPYSLAQDKKMSRIAVKKRLSAFVWRMHDHKLEPTPRLLAAAWRYGFTGMLGMVLRNVPQVDSDYPEQVANLYADVNWRPKL